MNLQGWERRSSGKFTIFLVFLRKRRRWAFSFLNNTLHAWDPPTFRGCFGLIFLTKRTFTFLAARCHPFLAVVRCLFHNHLQLKSSSLLNVYLNYKFEFSLLTCHLFFSLFNKTCILWWQIQEQGKPLDKVRQVIHKDDCKFGYELAAEETKPKITQPTAHKNLDDENFTFIAFNKDKAIQGVEPTMAYLYFDIEHVNTLFDLKLKTKGHTSILFFLEKQNAFAVFYLSLHIVARVFDELKSKGLTWLSIH